VPAQHFDALVHRRSIQVPNHVLKQRTVSLLAPTAHTMRHSFFVTCKFSCLLNTYTSSGASCRLDSCAAFCQAKPTNGKIAAKK
jgi:hypothetical protein